MKKVIWKLNDAENAEILELYEKRIALENLAKIINADDNELRQKLTEDYGNVLHRYQDWWDLMSTKYEWEKGTRWSIDFITHEVSVE